MLTFRRTVSPVRVSDSQVLGPSLGEPPSHSWHAAQDAAKINVNTTAHSKPPRAGYVQLYALFEVFGDIRYI